MNRFEEGVYNCMVPTAELLDRTTSPLQRAILLNWWRHVHLEGSGQFDKIVASEATSATEKDSQVSAILEKWAREMEALGVEVKGPWLVDFDCGAGCYCWKWPEEKLEYFHGYDEGFGGRVRIQ